jgi:hypothetical protein
MLDARGQRRAMIARLLFALIAGAWLLLATAAEARSPYAGRYRVAEGPDTAGMLDLRADGTFRYFLSEGALDEQAEGTWSETGGDIRLTTAPKPVAPSWARGPDGGEGSATIHVILADGRELAGIDFRLGLADGASMAGYTQAEGWSFAPGGERRIAWVELYEPIHGIASQRFAIDPPAAGGLVFVLTPNDIGMVDFNAAPLHRRSDDFVLDRRGRELRLVRER